MNELGDDGTQDLPVAQVIRTGEFPNRFLAEQLAVTTFVHS
ncbi:hypothetical protein [Streptomyces mirabilis]|jgi:hypothetical protein